MQLCLSLEEYVVFDFETTGLSPWGGDEIVEIGAMKVFGNEIDETNIFHTLVNPGRIITPDATRVNGITNEMVADAPMLDEAFPKFMEFIGDAYLVAQNAKFDMNFMVKYLHKYGLKRQLEVHDTIAFSRRCYPGEYHHNLDIICRRLGLSCAPEERHRSIGDVKLTAQAFILLKDRLGEKLPPREKWSSA